MLFRKNSLKGEDSQSQKKDQFAQTKQEKLNPSQKISAQQVSRALTEKMAELKTHSPFHSGLLY